MPNKTHVTGPPSDHGPPERPPSRWERIGPQLGIVCTWLIAAVVALELNQTIGYVVTDLGLAYVLGLIVWLIYRALATARRRRSTRDAGPPSA